MKSSVTVVTVWLAATMTLVHKTKPIKPHSPSSGFTLLELMITLLLIGILAGSSLLYIGNNDQSELSELRVDVLQLIQEARYDASFNERANFLNASGQQIWIDAQATSSSDASAGKRSINIPNGVDVYYAASESDDWSRLEASTTASWCISSSGLSEPIQLKFQLGDGAYDALTFDPFFLHPIGSAADDN